MNNTSKEKPVDPKVKELNLLLLYLSGWEEESRNNPGEKIFFSWKYNFDVLNALESDQFIHQVRNGKSVILTEAGRAEAERLKAQLLA